MRRAHKGRSLIEVRGAEHGATLERAAKLTTRRWPRTTKVAPRAIGRLAIDPARPGRAVTLGAVTCDDFGVLATLVPCLSMSLEPSPMNQRVQASR